MVGTIVAAIFNYFVMYLLRIVVDSIKNTDTIKEDSCNILDNLNEAIVSKNEGANCYINYANNLTRQIFKSIYQKCINENLFMPQIGDIEQYLSSKKEFFKTECLNDSYSVFDAFILKFKMFELY